MRPFPFALHVVALVLCVLGLAPDLAAAQTDPGDAPGAPDASLTRRGAWYDRDAAERRLALARVETLVAAATRDGRPLEAMDLLERIAADGLARDRDSLGRLIEATGAIPLPGSDPGWFYVGIPVLCASAVATGALGLVHALSAPGDATPFVSGYLLTGTALVTGVVLIAVGVMEHTLDPERQAFLARRRTVIRVFADARRGAGITW